MKKYENCNFFFTIFIFLFNPLTANDEISRHENLTFLRDLDTEVGGYLGASRPMLRLCNTLSSNKLMSKTVKILAVKWVNYEKV